MATSKLAKEKWRPFLDRATKSLIGKTAEVEVASLALGAQVEAEWLPLLGIVYDPKDDIVEVSFGDDIDHIINKPKELYIDVGPAGIISIEVVDGEDVRHIIKLRDPLMLPPPSEVHQTEPAGGRVRR